MNTTALRMASGYRFTDRLAVLRLPSRPSLCRALLMLVLCALPALNAQAVPDLRHAEHLHGLTVYPDSTSPQLFYYAPGDITLTSDAAGKPDFHVLSTRYTGSVATADRGRIEQRNWVSFHVRLDTPSGEQVARARRELQSHRRGRVELRPLPIQRLLTHLVYARASDGDNNHGDSDALTKPHVLPSAVMDTETRHSGGDQTGGGQADSSQQGYWQERRYLLSLSAADAQILRDALTNNQVLLSLSYAFIGTGIGMESPLSIITGSPELLALLEAEQDAGTPVADAHHVVHAGASAIVLDARRWPELVQQIDINNSLPPGYGALEVRCYDFQQDRYPRLFEKRVDLEARGISGAPVFLTLQFNSEQPQHHAQWAHFPVAVRLDQPYRYRVWEVLNDGSEQVVSDWQTRHSWSALLDVTRAGTIEAPVTDSEPSAEQRPATRADLTTIPIHTVLMRDMAAHTLPAGRHTEEK